MAERWAYAKINLTLEVGKKRPDGYHSLTSVMARATLADKVRVERNCCGKIAFVSTDKTIPAEDNLCTKAAKACLEALGIKGQGVSITLENNIPTASGMGGGSADAAAVIECMEELFGSLDSTVRHTIARRLGADVPYCLEKTPCLCTGIGDQCTPIECADLDGLWLVISKVGEKLSTGKVYSDFDSLADSDSHYDHTTVIKALEKGDIYALANGTFNDFEKVVFPSSPQVVSERERMLSSGALNVVMSGAGPTLVGFFDSKEKALTCSSAPQQIKI